MKRLSLALGLGLALALGGYFGFAEIAGGIQGAGWGVLAVIAFHPAQMVFSALAWQGLLPGPPAPGLIAVVTLRWIREGVNNLLPVAQIGGEVVGARLLRRHGVPLAAGGASVAVDLTIEFLTQVIFTLIGLALLVPALHEPGIVPWIVGTAALGGAVAALLVAVQRFGLFQVVERSLVRFAERRPAWSSLGQVAGLDRAIKALYASPAKLGWSCLHHLVSWSLGGLEVMLALHFVGVSVDLREGLIIESLGQAFRAVGFAIPGSLGVQEGGFIIACGLFGVSPQAAIELSLLKRIREVALGIPALVAWQVIETRPLVEPVAVPARTPAGAEGD
ncbi:MAG TPA: lysylphosphatidylglycerol synthase domain-containing protein [Dongiaceae bacterium]|jgi:putative membrane protein